MKALFHKDLKISLLENIHPSAIDTFTQAGCNNIEIIKESLQPHTLLEKCKKSDIIGVRSKTHITDEIIKQLPHLIAIGCFCVGTDQVDLNQATLQGVPVFNAPHSNTRSVAELVIGLTIMLMRDTFRKSMLAHDGVWDKSAEGSHEVRGKTLGIIGYGHIGSQVSVLAESLGLTVIFYDIERKLPLGNAHAMHDIADLLKRSDVVTLHVPDTKLTRGMVDDKFLKKMKTGSFLINASRGTVVDIEALSHYLTEKHLAGAAIDVYPQEPLSNKESFESLLRQHSNVILTPHVGGSTLEAQKNINLEVCQKLLSFLQRGSTFGSVNMPGLTLPPLEGTHRIVHIHHNIPGMLQKINTIIASKNINILSQYLLTNETIGYVVFDTSKQVSHHLQEGLRSIDGTIRTYLIY